MLYSCGPSYFRVWEKSRFSADACEHQCRSGGFTFTLHLNLINQLPYYDVIGIHGVKGMAFMHWTLICWRMKMGGGCTELIHAHTHRHG